MSGACLTHEELAIQERRKYPRLRKRLPIDVLPEGAAELVHTSTCDISCSGCYIPAKFTLSVGTRVAMTLSLAGEKIVTRAVATIHHSDFGTGFRFTDMTVEDLNKLNLFLNSTLGKRY